ncbi:MAG: YeiH family protein [Terriglobales bacterium]
MNPSFAKVLFIAGLVFALSPWASPPLALTLGLLIGLTSGNPFRGQTRAWTTRLLQASVVGLGFGMNLQQIVKAGRSGFVYTAIGISFAMVVGISLARLLKVRPTAGFLISTGTAICGGSAIAAVGPVVAADEEEMSVALGTVFILNSIALLIFPAIGSSLHLTQSQFGLWAALAIHDTSSVVGAGAKYGVVALAVATTVKLARALWIVPITLGAAAFKRRMDDRRAPDNAVSIPTKVPWPWFILLFVLAAVANSFVPAGAPAFHALARLGIVGLTVTLYLIGSSISRATLKQVGARPLIQGVLLWMIVAVVSVAAIRAGWVAL